MNKDQEIDRIREELRQENEHIAVLEQQMQLLTQRVLELEARLQKDGLIATLLPPSSRFSRPPKS